MPPHPQVVWQGTLRTLCDSRILVALWRHLQDIREANGGGLVHQVGILGKLDLEMGRVDEDTDGEKAGDWIVDEQAVHHFLDS